jgi:hypothetical protein
MTPFTSNNPTSFACYLMPAITWPAMGLIEHSLFLVLSMVPCPLTISIPIIPYL